MTQTDTPIAEMAERLTRSDKSLLMDPNDFALDDAYRLQARAHSRLRNMNLTFCQLSPLGIALRSHLMGGPDRGK